MPSCSCYCPSWIPVVRRRRARENTEQAEITEQTENSFGHAIPFVPLFPPVPYSLFLSILKNSICAWAQYISRVQVRCIQSSGAAQVCEPFDRLFRAL